MEVSVEPGKYVIAVSGGVDSVVLLDIVARIPQVDLIVAHYDHGIRNDSTVDRLLVSELADAYGLTYETEEGKLGPDASEAMARDARYAFLRRIMRTYGAKAIITAHHQDDLLETMVFNMLRGTNRRGLSSLKSGGDLVRPLLHIPKKELLRYAQEQGLRWHEDSTNNDPKYTRNYIRQNIMPRFAFEDRQRLLAFHHAASILNQEIDAEIDVWLDAHAQSGELNRHEFLMLPHDVAREVMAAWLVRSLDVSLSQALLERLVIAAKTGRIGSKFDVNKQGWLRVNAVFLALEPRER